MSEFKEKVEQFKQTFKESGFSTEEAPTIGGEPMSVDQEPQEQEAQEKVAPSKEERTSKRHYNSLRTKVDQLAYENRIREAQNQELLNRVQQAEQLLAEKQNRLEENQQQRDAYYERNLATQEQAIINALKVAKEEGDVDAEIALSKELAKVTADQSTYGLYKTQIQPQTQNDPSFYPAQNDDYGSYVQPDMGYVQENEALDDWLEENPWADPQSPNYSQRLRGEAETIASELEETLKYNGHADMIGSREYYHTLSNIMFDRYGKKQNQEESVEAPHYSSGGAVAPVSRRGSSMADQYISNNPNSTRKSMPLTEDEYKIARNLQIKLSNGRWATGDEAVRRYAEAKRMGSQGGSQKLIIE